MAQRKPFDLDRAVSMYQNDDSSTSQIAKIFNVHLQTVINRFKEAGIPLKSQGQAPNPINPNKIKHDYEIIKMSTSEIASKYSISISLVRKKLAECGIRAKKIGGSSRAIDIDQNELKIMYCDKFVTMRGCAKHFGVSSTVIKRHLKKLGINIRPSTKNLLINIDDGQIVDIYWNQKLSIAQTAKVIGQSENLVRGRLKVSGRGLRSWSEGSRLWRGSDDISNDQLIYLYDICGWSCEKISAHFNKSSQFTRHRFIAIGKKRRKNIGKYNGSWKGGITGIRNAIRSCAASLEWRKNAFHKQQYKSEISGQQIRELNCHHVYPFHIILRSSLTKHSPLPDEYRSLSIIGDPRFYDESNSLVVSKEEHDIIESDKLEQAHPWWKIWKAYPDFAISRSRLTSNDFKLFNSDGQIQAVEYNLYVSSPKEIRELIRYEHYLGTLPSSKLILIAKRGGIIIGVATFGIGTNRHIKDDVWELTRLCIPFYVVRPFACDFLNQCCIYIRNNYPKIKKLISFADSSVGHNGGVYRMAKWAKAGKTPPSYAYLDTTTFKFMHKASCRRIKGIDKTERELAQERGWIRIPLSHKYRYTLTL